MISLNALLNACQSEQESRLGTIRERVATYCYRVKLHPEGEHGLADGPELLAGMITVDPARAAVHCG